ncbi:MAG TPA: YciI family protein [Azospirillaceae bacterium]|nr:YciI family protein [Azospirillaceae bacterium]
MLFAVECLDKPDHGALRAETRQAHLEYLERNVDRVVFAGPLLTDDGASAIGSLLVIQAEDRADIERFCATDPYAKAGLFERTTIRPWRQVFPKA